MSVTHADQIEVTAESLQEDLARLEVQKQSLERELAAVSAHLDSVQRALGALQSLLPSGRAVPSAAARKSGDAPRTEPSAPAPTADPAPSTPAARAASTASGSAVSDEAGGQKYGRLTEQILGYFEEVGTADVRARDVAEALGRATDSGSINAVRSTLDRLVGTGRIRRAGRGLYRTL
ncbi:hypothetical protein OKJ48_42570 [Streptomyces kunmingensis]|uniref:Uncharacterized protein n=1 Tax=Streptomyces kunmingensis TaxID=68225 RepID=A0ABU6CR23_9ACTN|nr:hypothetical protein [Streptomyces kunmingensis]MEB3966874.1 hypothetical protein [Streptomyces kunmingensis]